MGEGSKNASTPYNVSHSFTIPEEDRKNYMNHVTHPLSSADISIFLLEISKFCCIKKYRYRLHFDTKFLILLTFFKNCLNNLMMSAKMATLGLLQIKLF